GGGGSVRRGLESILRRTLVCLHRQMTTETARRPRGVTDLAIHRRIIMRETCAALLRFRRNRAPSFSIALERFRVSGFGIVMRRERIDRVDRLWNFPSYVRRHTGLLPKFIAFPNKPSTKRRVTRV